MAQSMTSIDKPYGGIRLPSISTITQLPLYGSSITNNSSTELSRSENSAKFGGISLHSGNEANSSKNSMASPRFLPPISFNSQKIQPEQTGLLPNLNYNLANQYHDSIKQNVIRDKSASPPNSSSDSRKASIIPDAPLTSHQPQFLHHQINSPIVYPDSSGMVPIQHLSYQPLQYIPTQPFYIATHSHNNAPVAPSNSYISSAGGNQYPFNQPMQPLSYGIVAVSKPDVNNKPVSPKLKCQRCGITETPEWRRGPGGARTLCNACGLFHAKLVKKKGAIAAAEEMSKQKVRTRGGRRYLVHASSRSNLSRDQNHPTQHELQQIHHQQSQINNSFSTSNGADYGHPYNGYLPYPIVATSIGAPMGGRIM